ncbi:PocR ligand-binding domain-containing protein [Maridesulfovibrio hydrothermalis]|uniref:histidine kinase n=1 Tax=Maridesulfovibrio hydrothermalis AM13 = DSM 14728 TaxID=1121451 RepID=L0R9H5_9BACT|nr:PocR ligand-binding domain-containing protein [Maridesulfovibrio hydrothermalis]CCO23398.1 PAS/PAC sensor signal transduction histidine kinase [Maridesulfovibrio hydrothermalis AM13 = DSM 14728]
MDFKKENFNKPDVCPEDVLEELNTLRGRVAELEATRTLCGSFDKDCNLSINKVAPQGADNDYCFEDYFDVEAIQQIQDAFSKATNVASVITDLDGRPITRPSHFCRLCGVIRKTPKGLKNCMRSDASFGTKSPLEPIMRPCLSGGLWDGGTSFYVGDRHIANWIIGQVRCPPINDERIKKYAHEIGADEEEFMEALKEVPVMSREQFLNVCNVLCLIANQISILARKNFLQSQAIARRQVAEAALRESEERFRQLSESTFEAIFIHHKGEILTTNKAGQCMFGYSQEEFAGLNIDDLADPEYRDEVRERTAQNGKSRFDANFRCRRGKMLICEIQQRDIIFQGEKVGVCAIRDITERIESERQAKEKEQQLIQADKMVSLGVLVSGMAHEINNPNSFMTLNLPLLEEIWSDITPVLEGYYHENGEFLAGGLEYSELRNYMPDLLSRMQEGAIRISGIVNSLKDYSRLQPGELMWEVDLTDVINNSLRLLENLISQKTAKFEKNLAGSLPTVRGNSQRLSQVLINLLVNSCEALSDRKQRICLSSEYIEAEKRIEIVVRDEGVGIAEEHLKKIMDPFFTTKRDSGGTGLGLSVSATIVQEHGGELVFAANPGGGAVAKFSIPIIEKEDENA